jgi:hypothetical protein
MTQEHKDPRIEQDLRQEEMRQQRRRWEQEQRERKASEERREKQLALQSYLQRRGRDFMDYAGEEPTREDLARWRAEYLDELERKHQTEREAKLRAIEEEHYDRY